MASSFGWLDYSEYERRKALDVIALFRDQDTVDELGLGVIRDFLGTTTNGRASNVNERFHVR